MCGTGSVSGSSASWPARGSEPSTSGRSPRAPAARGGTGAEHLGAIAEDPRCYPDVFGRRRDREATYRLAHRVEQQIAGGRRGAADDDEVRVDEVAQVGHGAPDDATGVVDDAPRARVAFGGEGGQLGDGDRAVRAPQELAQGRRRGERLEASAIAAPANRALRID